MSNDKEAARQAVIDAVGAWREAVCMVRCDECDPSFGCFSAPSPGTALCRKPNALRCFGDNHVEPCPVETARQDLLAAHNHLGLVK